MTGWQVFLHKLSGTVKLRMGLQCNLTVLKAHVILDCRNEERFGGREAVISCHIYLEILHSVLQTRLVNRMLIKGRVREDWMGCIGFQGDICKFSLKV